ncbi:MAG TPA: hypothetical protein PK757_00625 [bacterium]|nr:hypothetical protein [bacterium]
MAKKLVPIKKNIVWLIGIPILSMTLIHSNFFLLSARAEEDKSFGLDAAATKAGLKTDISLQSRAGQIVGTVLSLVGILFFVLMIYGGILWMTAGGNDTQLKNAQKTITMAVIGLIIVLSAYAITMFIGQALI